VFFLWGACGEVPHTCESSCRKPLNVSLPVEVHRLLRTASVKQAYTREFSCQVFNSEWDQFVETWLPILATFVEQALGPYGTEPLPVVLPLPDGQHMSGATASFDMGSGQIRICSSVEGNPGQTLEKLTHELTHGALSRFPSVDCFYDEGYVDYSTWVLAHAPIYGEYRQQIIDAAAYNIKMRRERAMKDFSDYDRKRWAGGVFASLCLGPMILHKIRMSKADGNFNW